MANATVYFAIVGKKCSHIHAVMKRILIIEDDPSIYQTIHDALADAPVDLTWTRTAHEAFRIANDGHFDLAFIDLNISDMNPWSALDLFNILHPMSPAVILADNPPQISTALTCGADACILKPIDRSILAHITRQLLTETHQTRMDRLMNPFKSRPHLPSQSLRQMTTSPANENKNSPRR